MVVTPSGERVAIEPGQSAALELKEQGFYEVRAREADARPLQVVASNVDITESDPTPLDPQEIVATVGGGPDSTARTRVDAPSEEVLERSQRIWWYLLFAGILLLTAETWLAQRLSRAAS